MIASAELLGFCADASVCPYELFAKRLDTLK